MVQSTRQVFQSVVWVTAFLATLASIQPSQACTVMQTRVGGVPIVARNHDWVSGGGLVIVNPSGIVKKSLSPVRPHEWTSRYGSVSFNQFGREIPFAGMNEKGLTVDLLQLHNAEFPPGTDEREAVNVVQWVQYQLDMSATVAEVVDSLQRVRPMPFVTALEKVHYFVADASGDAAVIEFLNGKAVVKHSGQTTADESGTKEASQWRGLALANSSWEDSSEVVAGGEASTGSLRRFAKAWQCSQQGINDAGQQAGVQCAFDVLESVRQSHTQWSLVYEPTLGRVSLKTDENPQLRWIDLKELKLAPGEQVLCVDIQSQHTGNLAGHLKPLTKAANVRIVDEAFDAIVPPSFVRTAVKQLLIQYGETLSATPVTVE
ncbi:linear amide C-N hydrolase [Neorhodopirellula lusitana]|uniref:linear amide C-N hydrolase n=1 Tax=Neorhodopirellula lusitana TaxID=445327 RepID=UPI00384EED35